MAHIDMWRQNTHLHKINIKNIKPKACAESEGDTHYPRSPLWVTPWIMYRYRTEEYGESKESIASILELHLWASMSKRTTHRQAGYRWQEDSTSWIRPMSTSCKSVSSQNKVANGWVESLLGAAELYYADTVDGSLAVEVTVGVVMGVGMVMGMSSIF